MSYPCRDSSCRGTAEVVRTEPGWSGGGIVRRRACSVCELRFTTLEVSIESFWKFVRLEVVKALQKLVSQVQTSSIGGLKEISLTARKAKEQMGPE